MVTLVSVHPARRCTSPLGVVPVGLGDGVGACHDVANLPRKVSFLFPFHVFFDENPCSFYKGMVSFLVLCTAEYAGSQARAHPMLP